MDIKKSLMESICEYCDMENINTYLQCNDDLTKLGMNSISFIKLVVNLENKFNIEFDDENLDYNKFTSLIALCDYIKEKLKNGVRA